MILKPTPRVWLRTLLLGLLMLPIPFASATWVVKLTGLLLWTALLGSYRIARIEEGAFVVRLVVGFVPLRPRRVRLERVARLTVDIEQPTGTLWVFVIGPWNLMFSWLFDWLLPWLGGRYRVWLVSAKGRRVLAWQGNSDAFFRDNVDRLESATGLVLERGST